MSPSRSDRYGTTFEAVFSNEKVLVFFGTRHTTRESVINLFPFNGLQFAYLKQVHGCHCEFVGPAWPFFGADIRDGHPTGDALYTKDKNVALGITTADCLPILVYDPKLGQVLAVHAGWRGLVEKILAKSLNRLISAGSMASEFQVWLGPHIRRESFEVGLDVAQQLAAASRLGEIAIYEHANSQKKYVDLMMIARAQLLDCGIPEKQIWIDGRDTFKDLILPSYRREGAHSGRIVSLIMKST